MLTRRQARLLGLTTSDDAPVTGSSNGGGDPSSVSGASPSSPLPSQASSLNLGSPSGLAASSNPSVSSRGGGGDGGSHSPIIARAVTMPGASIVLRLGSSSSMLSRHGGSATQLVSSPSSGLLNFGGGGSRGRLGVRQAESMLSRAQSVIDYWAASGTTTGPIIQLASKHGRTLRVPLAAAAPATAPVSYAERKSTSGSEGNNNVASSCIEAPSEGSSSPVFSSVSAASADATSSRAPSSAPAAQRPPRLSTTQLRSRWRGVVRNCTTMQVTVKANTSTPAFSSAGESPAEGLQKLERGERKLHVLRLTALPDAADKNDDRTTNAENEEDESESRTENGGRSSFTLMRTHGSHRDMIAAPVTSSRRNTHFFISPFHSDAPPSGAVRGGHDTRCSTSAGTRKLLTSLALRQLKATQTSARQRRLSHEVYYQVYVKAHEARMRMLFGLSDPSGRDVHGSMGGADGEEGGSSALDGRDGHAAVMDSIAAGEAAYLQSLDPSSSEEEAKVLQVIASIDRALKQQLAAAYHHKMSGPSEGNEMRSTISVNGGPVDKYSGPAQQQEVHEMQPKKHHVLQLPTTHTRSSIEATPSMTRSGTASSSSSAALNFFSARRPAILEAVIASTTQSVSAFTDQLLPYQQEGVRWLLRLNTVEHMNGILADDMGLGKTAQTVVYLSCYKELVEAQVQHPLRALQVRLHQVCQRALGLTAGTASIAEAELPPWLAWCAAASAGTPTTTTTAGGGAASSGGLSESSGEVADEDGIFFGGATGDEYDDDDGALFMRSSMSASGRGGVDNAATAHVRTAQACGRMLRLVKEVKRWLWQFGDDVDEKDEVDKSARKNKNTSASPNTTHTSTGARTGKDKAEDEEGEEENGERADVDSASMTPTSAEVVPLLPIKKRRGRPPKHLSAMMAAAAAAVTNNGRGGGGAREGGTPSSSRSSLTSSPVPSSTSASGSSPVSAVSLPAFIRSQSGLPSCSSALNDRLDHDDAVFRPVLIIAPLSTLPHWAGEFHRFSRRRTTSSTSSGSAGGASGSSGGRRRENAEDSTDGADDAAHLERFAVYVLNGPRADRENRMREFLAHTQRGEHQLPTTTPAFVFPATPVLVIPHDMLTKPLSGPLRQISRVRWHVVVIDEAQRIKSAQSTLFKKVRLLSSISRLVLTGTPLQNNTTELFSLLQFLAPQSFTASAGDLFEQLDSALVAASRSNTLEDRELHILLCRRVHRLLMPFILRREKNILKAQLPPIRDYAVLCPLMPFQQTQLEEVRRKHEEGTLSGNPHIQYRKILLHPYTTQAFFYVDEAVVQTSGKLLVLDFMMRFLQRTRHKFLIFCGWTLVLDVVETLCGMRQIPYVRLDGRTPVEKREANIKGFNQPLQQDESSLLSGEKRERAEGGDTASRHSGQRSSVTADGGEEDADLGSPSSSSSSPCCFLISKVAGGVGLNLQAADTVFLLDVDYNPQRDAQALSRVYRVGQTREVRVFRLVIDHPIERNIVAIHEAKENLGRAVVQAGRYDLHSSVKEREEALQHIFRSGTMSQISEQWSSASPTSAHTPTSPTSAEKVGEDEEDEDEGEEDRAEEAEEVVQGGFPAAPHEHSNTGRGVEGGEEENLLEASRSSTASPSPAHSPADIHRVFVHAVDPAPSALKRPKQEVIKVESEKESNFESVFPLSAANDALVLSSPHFLPPQTSLSLHGVTNTASPLSAAPHRKRRHISFKLEDDGENAEEGSRKGNSARGHTLKEGPTPGGVRGGFDREMTDSGAAAAAAAGTATSKAGTVGSGGQSADAGQPAEAAPAAHLLAMRERLEEVLLRHDGERTVLHDMFRSLEASLAASTTS